MQLRKVKLIPNDRVNSSILEAEAEDEKLYCWKSECRPCTSNCAAWRINDNVLMCMALPTDKRVGQITKQKKEIPDPPKPPEKRIVKEGHGSGCYGK